ncbi:MAG: hypothetical protein ACI9OF_002121, partial [Saprospiraceae bacterium]
GPSNLRLLAIVAMYCSVRLIFFAMNLVWGTAIKNCVLLTDNKRHPNGKYGSD